MTGPVSVVVAAVLLCAVLGVAYKALARPLIRRHGHFLAGRWMATASVTGSDAEIRTLTGDSLKVDLRSVKGIAYYQPMLASVFDENLHELRFFNERGKGTLVPGWHPGPPRDGKPLSGLVLEAGSVLRDISRACPSWCPMIIKGYTAYRAAQTAVAACLSFTVLAVLDALFRDPRWGAQPNKASASLLQRVILLACAAFLPLLLSVAWRILVRRQFRAALPPQIPSSSGV